MAHPGLAGDRPHAAMQMRAGVEVDDGIGVDHPVIAGDQEGALGWEVGQQIRHRAVDIGQYPQPLRRFRAVQVAGDVQVGEVGVREAPAGAAMACDGADSGPHLIEIGGRMHGARGAEGRTGQSRIALIAGDHVVHVGLCTSIPRAAATEGRTSASE